MQYESSVCWKCPSNIALVKYWGKHGRQLPRNASISFTLNNAHTITRVHYKYVTAPQDHIKLSFLFEDKANKAFESKIQNYLEGISDVFPLVRHLQLHVESRNSFPHSSGIASSASGMAALAMCLLDIDSRINNLKDIDLKKASFLARLGSGSASRSVIPYIGIWGNTDFVRGSSDDYAIQYTDGIDPSFLTYHDDILIVSKGEKAVSSRAGHALMDNNPYSPVRFAQANQNVEKIIVAMQQGDHITFGQIVESEALTLHALMMSSYPPYILMEPQSLQIIKAIQNFRSEHNIPVCFTLDAGPNIHMLYPDIIKDEVAILKSYLKTLCQDEQIIEDQVGQGPQKMD